jgi:hypothetical protein
MTMCDDCAEAFRLLSEETERRKDARRLLEEALKKLGEKTRQCEELERQRDSALARLAKEEAQKDAALAKAEARVAEVDALRVEDATLFTEAIRRLTADAVGKKAEILELSQQVRKLVERW